MAIAKRVTSVAEPLGALPPLEMVFGRTPAMLAVRERLEKLARTNVPVLIQGESGTGKDVIARMIHLTSPWKGRWLRVSCPTVSGLTLENGWLGQGNGFGASGQRPRRGGMNSRGTLFLDEVADLEPGLQSSLLQWLQDSQFSRLGPAARAMDVRVVCATSRNLEHRISIGSFREDLFYRINVVNLTLPPLRQRRPDIEPLAGYFLDHLNRKYDCRARPLSSEMMALLDKYHWPGNIRELENLIKRYVILGSEGAIRADLAQPQLQPGNLDLDLNFEGPVSLKALTRRAVRQLEHRVILKMLQANHWNRKRTAQALGISYRALLYKIQDSGLAPHQRGPENVTEVISGGERTGLREDASNQD